MIKSIKHSVLILSVVALFSACTETKTKDTTAIPVLTEKADCLYSFDESAIKVYWAAYKTEDKLKVVGQFKELKTDRSDQQFSSLAELVNGINFSINTASSASGDEIRDVSLKEYFFKLFTANFEINGSLAEMNEESITATINMFGTAKTIELTYSVDKGVLKMKGALSLEEFGAINAYNSIHTKCFDLHKGKTWDGVDVIIEVPISKDCQ
jgi:hypothetical protein